MRCSIYNKNTGFRDNLSQISAELIYHQKYLKKIQGVQLFTFAELSLNLAKQN